MSFETTIKELINYKEMLIKIQKEHYKNEENAPLSALIQFCNSYQSSTAATFEIAYMRGIYDTARKNLANNAVSLANALQQHDSLASAQQFKALIDQLPTKEQLTPEPPGTSSGDNRPPGPKI